jgi:site-specific recombinase XerD
LYLLLGVTTGFRAGELLTLTFGQLLGPDGHVAREVTISRRFLKGGRGGHARSIASRRVALGARARTAIAQFLTTLVAIPPTGSYVFSSRKGANRPITRCHAHYVLKSLARELGLEASRLGTHSARKTFANGVFELSGHDLVRTQRLFGHASPSTTARYISSSTEELDALATGFDPLATARAQPVLGASAV